MLLKKIAKKSIAILIVFLLLLSFNVSLNVTAKWDIAPSDGVAFDDFDTDEDITYINCNYSKGSIKLDFGAHNITYDRKVTPEKIEAWKIDPLLIKPGDEGVGGFLSQFLSLDQLTGEEFSSDEYEDLWYADNNVVETEALVGFNDEPNWPLNLFRFDLDFNKDTVDTFRVDWYFGDFKEDTNLEEISMFVWSYGDLLPRWREFDIGTYPDIVNTTLNTILSKKYINGDGLIDVLIVGKPKELRQYTYLYTDYVKLEISIDEGYLPNGNVTSTLIEPAILNGWEQVIWSGSRPSTNSWVKIQVLDENNNVIEALDGNSEGFTTSPIDISSIDVDVYSKIKLRALLHSENLEFTPRLNGWGVLWQTKSGFYDSFTYEYRIDESYGVNIEGGEVKVSEFYSDWPLFGKNSENTRSYTGQELKIGKNQTYWFTEDELDIGGGFRSPVVKDGKVYVASETNKIYAFNLTTDDPNDEQLPFDIGDTNVYKVDNSLAVADNLVIVGTGDTGENNVIYALNASNLNHVMWYFEYDENDKPICYSGAPTIANERIFITSWSGKFHNNPMLSYLFSWLNTQLQKLDVDLGINNKLIALDIDGNEIWDPIDLPASSYCTPAVHNGLVYVGCENYNGPSFFAFDENTGEEIWNATIGLIGKSAPVVADGKVFVLSREQSLFALKGDDKVSALDAETGEMLWNKTIGNDTTIIGNVLKGYGYDNLIATSSPVSTPAYYQGTLFVMSINGVLFAIDSETGEEKWTFNSTEYTKGADFIPYHTASPVVVDDIVYIATTDYAIITENAYVYALDNSNDGDILWDYQILDPIYDPAIPQRHLLLASPIVTDGLVLLSENRWVSAKQEHEGRIQCVGEYSKNSMGILYSVPVHVQKGKWWNKFNAVTENTKENNTITFEILDGNGEPFNGFGNLNGTNNNISGIKENVIQLCAHLTIGNSSEPLPLLKSWEILWITENQAPEFIDSSFEPGQEGWINLNLKNCSIEVKDKGVNNVISGLDTSSAKYQLEYVKEGSDTPVTEWFDAVCDQESGALETKMTARISEDLNVDITDLRNITFTIKDLAGNEATSGTVTFKIDNDKPTSSIKDPDDFESKYIEPVTIEAEGNDGEGSGIVKIALYYRPTGSSDWSKYKPDDETLDDPPHVWSFEINVSDSYELTTSATDKANNKEDLPSDGDISFLFDMNKPPKPDYEDEYYFNTLPVFTGNKAITFSDDYQLESIEYQLDIHGEFEWIVIADNLNGNSYSEDWGLTQSDWDTIFEDETHFLYFRITDYCGNVYETPLTEALKIIKDVTPPIAENVSLDLSGYDGGGDDEFTITANIPDEIDVSYVTLEYSYSSDDSKWSEWKQYGDNIGDGPYTWDFKAGDGSGYYKFRTTIFDEAGNFVQSPIKSVNITIFPTTLTLLLVILIIILFVFTIIVVRKMSKKKE